MLSDLDGLSFRSATGNYVGQRQYPFWLSTLSFHVDFLHPFGLFSTIDIFDLLSFEVAS